MDKKLVYSEISCALQAYRNCIQSGNETWEEKWEERIESLVNKLPSGAGITTLNFDMEKSNPNKLIFTFSYAHYTECGFHDGYTDHKLIVTPDLYYGANLNITGRNKNDVKDYLYEIFNSAMFEEVIE